MGIRSTTACYLTRRARRPPDSDRARRWTGPRVLTEYRFENPGRAFLRTKHPEETPWVDTTGDLWEHPNFGRIDWRKIYVPEPLKQAMQHYVFHELEAGASLSGFRCFGRLLAIQRVIDPKIAFPLLRERTFKILAALHDPQLFGEFRRFFRWAAKRSIPGFDRLILRDMERLRPPKADRRIDARNPGRYLKDEEQRLLLTALEVIPSVDDPRLRDHVLVQLCWELGCRPDQARGIEERHVHQEHVAGVDYYHVEMPRAKQRTVTIQYKRRPLSAESGHKIVLLVAQNRKQFGPSDASSPIFRTQSSGHRRSKHFGNRINNDTASRAIADFISETLGYDGYRGARMLRHNMAQRMADMGAPAAVVAEALDHSDLTSVDVYVRSKPDVAELKTRALGKSKVYRDVLDWLNGKEPVPRAIVEPERVVQGLVADRYIGNIGACDLPKDRKCPHNPVYSCYGCQKFTPFIDGDHEAVADAMAQENLQLLGVAGAEGNRVALTNEYPIVVARAVQVLCDNKRGE
jgi:integrase